MRNIVIKVAYDGTNYHGWQRQSADKGNTVQQTLEKGLSRLLYEEINLNCAGRTDSGVHAYAQFANFETASTVPVDLLKLAVNRLLPMDIQVLNAWELPLDFHPRKMTHHTTYCYTVSLQLPSLFAARYCCYEPKNLNIEKMRQASTYLLGEHDFSAFTVAGSAVKTTVRCVENIEIIEHLPIESALPWQKQPDMLSIEVTAGGFLYKMVRLITARLLQVGRGEQQPEYVLQLLNNIKCKPIAPAAPQGLMLKEIIYDNYEEFFQK